VSVSTVTDRDVTVVEVAPRDGLQNESLSLSTDEKLELVRHAVGFGVRNVEVMSFALPKKCRRWPTRRMWSADP
jgi:hydroxymethylglutaryl-CoA lyase